jgi:ubiquinone/menaquinone biosynthesis C-methylase UbiE
MSGAAQDYFDRLGGDWDELRAGYFGEQTRERALAVADVRAGDVAADVGAGTGYLTEALAARGAAVIAVDSSRPMLAALVAKLPPGSDVVCRSGAAEALPIADRAVDHAFANMVLHHVESPPAAIAEMTRILKPGGSLVLSDLDRHDHEFLIREQHDRWKGFDREEVREWLRAAGLLDVRVDCAEADCCATSAAGQAAAVSIFVASARKPAPG